MTCKESKSQTQEMLRNAREQHLKWVSEVQHRVSAQVELDHTRCEFGKWYLAACDELQDLQEFKNLDEPHRELHSAYKLIKSTPGLDNNLAEEIRHLSNQLIERIDLLERRLSKPISTGC